MFASVWSTDRSLISVWDLDARRSLLPKASLKIPCIPSSGSIPPASWLRRCFTSRSELPLESVALTQRFWWEQTQQTGVKVQHI